MLRECLLYQLGQDSEEPLGNTKSANARNIE